MPTKKISAKRARPSTIKTKRVAKKRSNKTSSAKGKLQIKNAALYGVTLLAVLGVLTFVGLLNPVSSVNNISYFSSNKASLALESDQGVFKKGDKVKIKVISNSDDTSVNAVQSMITFPESLLKLDQVISSASAFPIDAQQTIDNNEIFIVRGVVGGVTESNLISELEFTAIESGVATVSFNKTESVLADSETNQNLLNDKSYKNLTIEVQ